MCIKLGGKKSSGPSPEDIAAQERAAMQEQLITEQRRQLAAQNSALVESQKAFQTQQNSFLQTVENMNVAAEQRQAAQYATQNAAKSVSLVQTGDPTQDEPTGDDLLDAQRRGRRALRIDLNAPSTAGAAPGLNIPRG